MVERANGYLETSFPPGRAARTPDRETTLFGRPGTEAYSTHLPVLAAQPQDAKTLAADAQARGWIDEADRHHRLIARLDAVMTQAAGT